MLFRSELGLNVTPDDFIPFVGTGENRYLGGVAEKYGKSVDIDRVKARTYEIYKSIIRGNLTALPGVYDFIERCRKKGLKLAIATSADLVKMEANLEEIGLPAGSFHATVNGLEVENKKPFPDIYLKAAMKLNLQPAGCLVVEDAVSGIKAARVAGCRCLAVTTSFTRNELTGADWIYDSLEEVPEEVLNW